MTRSQVFPVHRRAAITLSIVAAMIVTTAATAQEPPALDADERAAVALRIGELLAERYVFADVGEACQTHVREELEAGVFEDTSDPTSFAERLTTVVQSISHDKHMRVRVRPEERAEVERVNPMRAQADRLDRMRRQNFGFERVERLEGNVGYLDMRYFAGSPQARPTAVAAMNFLANADAIIFDMRQNGGGSPEMIRFICSYLFEAPTHLNSLYWRAGDRTDEFWTLPDVPGPRLADVPVFVLTSSYTFSGAEEFSYNLQTRERATLIGETTGGGANPGGSVPVSDRFEVFIPTGRAINPVTGTNWEGVGVAPEIAVSSEEAYETGLALAQEAAETYRDERAARITAAWSSLDAARPTALQLSAEGRKAKAAEVMTTALADARAANLLGEMEINQLGYEFLGIEHVDLAIAVFTFNTEAYPTSSNVYDSLAEACMNDGQNDRAVELYRRSLELDPTNRNAELMIERIRGNAEADG